MNFINHKEDVGEFFELKDANLRMRVVFFSKQVNEILYLNCTGSSSQPIQYLKIQEDKPLSIDN